MHIKKKKKCILIKLFQIVVYKTQFHETFPTTKVLQIRTLSEPK